MEYTINHGNFISTGIKGKEPKMKTKPTILICMPCYDDVKINTMLSIFKMAKALSKSGIEVGINTMKSPLIHQARNYLTATFLKSSYSHFIIYRFRCRV